MYAHIEASPTFTRAHNGTTLVTVLLFCKNRTVVVSLQFLRCFYLQQEAFLFGNIFPQILLGKFSNNSMPNHCKHWQIK